ncbi:DUF1376 domain-containing protein [Sulfitobacter sp. CS16]|uniref:DUF1376 domain-containing protein n=1 Tax=Sulfitobacter sp. CS16 TaxID=3368573 RepID=UPI003745B905
MNALPYYPRYPRDFFEGTAGMSLEEKGAYGLVLDLIYMMGARGLPDDPQYIAGQLGTSVRKWNSLRKSLIERGKINIKDGLICNGRAEKEKAKQKKYQGQQAENASSTGHGKTDDLGVNSGSSGDKPEIISSKSGDNLAENKSVHNENNNLEKPSPTSREEPEPEPYKIDDDSAGAAPAFRERVLLAAGHDASGLTSGGRMIGNRAEWAEFEKARSDLHLSEEDTLAVVRETANQKRDGPPGSLKYFIPSMRKFAGARDAPAVSAIAPDPARTRGTQHERFASKSKRRMDAFIAGARGTG